MTGSLNSGDLLGSGLGRIALETCDGQGLIQAVHALTYRRELKSVAVCSSWFQAAPMPFEITSSVVAILARRAGLR